MMTNWVLSSTFWSLQRNEMRLYGDSDALGTLFLTNPCVLGNEYLALFSFFFLKLALHMHNKQFFKVVAVCLLF